MDNIKEGIYLVDKPSGPSSHDVVNLFRKRSGIKRIGHTGTLDPLASGLLIILIGRNYTKKQNFYLKKDKEYLVEAELGLETDTYDCTGQIIKSIDWQKTAKIKKSDIKKAITKFHGKIQQTVPIFSAIKIRGEKLYQKARKKEPVNLPEREIEIKKIVLKSFKKNVKKEKSYFTLLVACSSGTYIRSLIHDIGQELGCGATVTSLRRIKIDKINVKKAEQLGIDEFKKDWDN